MKTVDGGSEKYAKKEISVRSNVVVLFFHVQFVKYRWIFLLLNS